MRVTKTSFEYQQPLQDGDLEEIQTLIETKTKG